MYLHMLSCLWMYFVNARTGQPVIKCWIFFYILLAGWAGIIFYRFADVLFDILCGNGVLLLLLNGVLLLSLLLLFSS